MENDKTAIQMYRECLRKRKYRTQEIAEHYKKIMDKKYDCENRVYLCSICGAWHLTSKPLRLNK